MGKPWRDYSGPSLYPAVKLVFAIGAIVVFVAGCDGIFNAPKPLTRDVPSSIPNIPPPASLLIQLVPGGFHKLDFMALHGCLLQTTLGKFQSLPGRYASASQRLLLDLEYLRLAPLCIKYSSYQGKLELAERLLELQNMKRQQLPALIFNATLANTEFQQFWLATGQPNTQEVQTKLSLAAMADIHFSAEHWLDGNYRASNLEFEIQLSEVAKANSNNPQAMALRQRAYQLEALLKKTLPSSYRHWMANRDEHFTKSGHATVY